MQVQVIARICVLATLQLSVYTMNSQTIAIYFISHSVILYALFEKIANKKKHVLKQWQISPCHLSSSDSRHE